MEEGYHHNNAGYLFSTATGKPAEKKRKKASKPTDLPKSSSQVPINPHDEDGVTAVASESTKQELELAEPLDFGDVSSIRAIAFVNGLSGDQKGKVLLKQLKENKDPRLLVFDVLRYDIDSVLTELRQQRSNTNTTSSLTILACGGDGTVCSVIQGIFTNKLESECVLGIVPIGTGNDTSREFGWGRSFNPDKVNASEHTSRLLEIHDTIQLDIWKVSFTFEDEQKNKCLYFCNYFNIGMDAEISLGFHEHRKERPSQYETRVSKSFWYLFYALKATQKSKVLGDCVTSIKSDDESLRIPSNARTLVFLNFKSYQNGVDIWWNSQIEKVAKRHNKWKLFKNKISGKERGKVLKPSSSVPPNTEIVIPSILVVPPTTTASHSELLLTPPENTPASPKTPPKRTHSPTTAIGSPALLQSASDQLIEVAAIEGPAHEAMLRMKFKHAKRLAQSKRITLQTKYPLAVAVDGEPQLIDGPCCIVIELAGSIPLLSPPPSFKR